MRHPDFFSRPALLEPLLERYYGIPAARLDGPQAAELAAGLSRPRSWNPASDSRGYRQRVRLIRGRMSQAGWLRKEL